MLIDDAHMLVKEFRFPDFKQALAFANKVGEVAEEEQHHPDMTIGWGNVSIELSTHAIGGLSENDFILAAKIDKIS
jgi:4a-hydroxytetrahydrobiopterin dehydratase